MQRPKDTERGVGGGEGGVCDTVAPATIRVLFSAHRPPMASHPIPSEPCSGLTQDVCPAAAAGRAERPGLEPRRYCSSSQPCAHRPSSPPSDVRSRGRSADGGAPIVGRRRARAALAAGDNSGRRRPAWAWTARRTRR